MIPPAQDWRRRKMRYSVMIERGERNYSGISSRCAGMYCHRPHSGGGYQMETDCQSHVRDFSIKKAALPVNFLNAKRCGAKTRQGTSCLNPAMPNGRCRMHGGKNPGAPKGNRNALKHGRYSQESLARKAEVQAILRESKEMLSRIILIEK